MGIPSYFSKVIKNYPQIVQTFKHHQRAKTHFHNLYMDCNSIVYDAIRAMPGKVDETKLIQEVISQIGAYIYKIKPSDTVIVAFDGVAPFAKMNQQKTRRYKSSFLSQTSEWSTSNITPGTKFMEELSKQLYTAFSGSEAKYHVKKMVVSGSDENGEGEHKIFKYVRENPRVDQNVLVYGLDSDLIMLTIFHSHLYANGFIFRETPEFAKSCGKTLDPKEEKELSFLDIRVLCDSIGVEMGRHNQVSISARVYDYVFMCFLLGNDFLPHFPALNLRTHGMDTLMSAYGRVVGKHAERFLVNMSSRTINWPLFSLFVKDLAKNEHKFLLSEYELRDKQDKRVWAMNTQEERDFAQLNIPIIYRKEEKYICPTEPMWEDRYYKALLGGTGGTYGSPLPPPLLFDERSLKGGVVGEPCVPYTVGSLRDSVCLNYLEGLEWVFRYYSGDCPDWRWTYEHHYPPLLTDLQHRVPDRVLEHPVVFIKHCRPAFTSSVQLAYVLPTSQFDLLPAKMREFLLAKQYSNDLVFQWAFCRYFWEAHVCFPPISVEELAKW